MRYADTLLADGEIIHVRERQHWLALLLEARAALALWLLAAVTFILGILLDTQAPQLRDILGWIALIALVIGLLVFFVQAWQWWAQDYLITNRRILKVEGVFNKRSADSSLEKINDAVLSQNVIARIMGYGDLDILTAADTAIDRYRMLNRAPSFKREMINQKHALEMEFSYRQPPSPPFRAGPAAAATAGAASAASAGSGRQMEVDQGSGVTRDAPLRADTPEADTPDEVTRLLTQLADLRDRGAISAEEYETKKRDLLGRL
jgi:hypothetical protein